MSAFDQEYYSVGMQDGVCVRVPIEEGNRIILAKRKGEPMIQTMNIYGSPWYLWLEYVTDVIYCSPETFEQHNIDAILEKKWLSDKAREMFPEEFIQPEDDDKEDWQR